MLISKSSLTGGWQVEHSAIEFSEMLSAVKVEDKSIVASLAIGKESGVSSEIMVSSRQLKATQFQGFAGRIGRGISGNTKAKTKKMDFPNKETATVNTHLTSCYAMTCFNINTGGSPDHQQCFKR